MSYAFGPFQFPFGGGVMQDIATALFSQKVEINYAGVAGIERDVVTDVASFGRQLGIVSEAVVELAGSAKGEKVGRLRKLVGDVDAVKRRHRRDVERQAEEAIESLRKLDEAALRRLLDRYSG